ncbi:MAG: AsmA family protein [Desulfobulbus sp.]|nr:AsmA family protein [Desulfobulbus sp.]
MDSSLIYAKTPAGGEAVRQSTRVVQRNLRMVLLQVDGTLSVEQLVTKIGNQRLVESALQELEEGGFIEVVAEPARPRADESATGAATTTVIEFSAISQFSTFGPHSAVPSPDMAGGAATSGLSVFSRSLPPFLVDDRVADSVADQRPLPPIRRIALGRWLFGGVIGALLLLLAVLLFYPYDNFRPGLEAELSRQLAMPVRIGEVRLALLPRPRLLLNDVTIGADDAGRIASLAIASPHLLLGADGRVLPEVEASGVRLTASRLVELPLFGGAAVGERNYPVQLLRVAGATIALGDLASPEWSGEIHLQADGRVDKAHFRAADDSLHVEATPTAQGVALAIDSVRWNPEGMPFAFDALQASGVLQKNRLSLQGIDASFLGGRLHGNGALDWSAGMAMTGEASLARLDSHRTTTALAPNLKLEGELNGTVRLRATGSGWQDMLGHIEADLDAQVARGLLTGIDLGELARQGSSSAVVQAGSTRFEMLRARLDIAPGRVVARAINLDAGLMTASGRATVEAGGQVEGKVTVQARSSVTNVRVSARLSGVLPSMILTVTTN